MANKLLKTLDFGTGDVYRLAPDWEDIQNKPEDIGGGGSTGGGGTADSVEWDNVQNKPFGYGEEKVLMNNQTLTLTDGMYASSEPVLIENCLYKMTVNGTAYESVAQLDAFMGMIYIGDAGIVSGAPSGNFPFVAVLYEGEFMFALNDGSTECTVTLTEREMTKIPDAYYDKGSPMQLFVESSTKEGYIYKDVICSLKVTADELMEMANKGPIILRDIGFTFYFPQQIQVAHSVAGEAFYQVHVNREGTILKYYTAEHE